MKIHDVVRLSELLGEMGTVKRATHLPSGENESDSHHSFSLALIAYHIVTSEELDLDVNKVVLFSLAHDLLEIVTGDQDTLHFTPEQHAAKQQAEEAAMMEFEAVFSLYPDLRRALHDYERLDSPEAATVFVLDKACTTWTWLHHPDMKGHSEVRYIQSIDDVEGWAQRQREKIHKRLAVMPPQTILNVYEESFSELKRKLQETWSE